MKTLIKNLNKKLMKMIKMIQTQIQQTQIHLIQQTQIHLMMIQRKMKKKKLIKMKKN